MDAACASVVFLIVSSAFLSAQSFEKAEGFREGKVGAASGWADSEELAAISTIHSVSGTQSLRISGHSGDVFVEKKYLSNSQEITFVDFRIRPSVDVDEPAVTIDANGALIGFASESDNFAEIVCAVGGENSDPEDFRISRGFAIDPAGEAAEWVRITIRQDSKQNVWDLFVNGDLAVANLPLVKAAGRRSLRFYAGKAPVYLDDVQITVENPLFPDADRDGMSDVYEKATRLNPYLNDRQADRDSDQIPNIAEAVSGSRPDVAGVNGRRIIYVDNSIGARVNSGESPGRDAGLSGPKVSLKDAMREAAAGDVVVVLKGAGAYHEGTEPMPGGDIAIVFENDNTVLKLE